MDVPESLYLEHLHQTSERIAAFEDPDFESASVNGPEATDLGDAQPLSLTTVYALPDQPDPRLRKTEFRNTDEVPDPAIEAMVRHFAGRNNAETASMGHDDLRSLADMFAGARDEVAGETSILVPFKTLAMSAIYNTSGNTIYMYNFAATDFLDALATRFPEAPGGDEISEETLKGMYARESEQNTDIEPYEEWEDRVRQSLSARRTANMRGPAFTAISTLLLPPDATHPVLRRRLFEEAAE